MHWIPAKMTALTAALLLSACGGGGSDPSAKVTFSSMVSFGDSLSDVGSYQVGSIAAVGGGKWTVNGTTTGPVNWTELLASQLKLGAPCAAQTGMLPSPTLVSAGIVSVPVANHAGCTNYAQGGARVSSAASLNGVALQTLAGQENIGLLTAPLVDQFARHLSAHGNYTGTELVTVMAGANDALMHLAAVAEVAKWLGGDPGSSQASAVGAAALAGWSSTEQAAIAAGGAGAVTAATTAAVTHMAIHAATLAGYVQASVVGRGAKYVVVVNIPSLEKTPFGQSTNAGTQALLAAMVTTFNSTLQTALAGTAGVLLVDAYTQGMDQYNNPTQYGITNVTTPACSASGNILGGSSLAGVDTSNYEFADGVHPTPATYKLLERHIALQMAKAGWL